MLVDALGKEIYTEGIKVEASFKSDDATLSDHAEEGMIAGHIISFIYVDDHYTYTVRTKSEEDYVVNDEDLWNQGDYVSVVVPKDKISYRLIEKE